MLLCSYVPHCAGRFAKDTQNETNNKNKMPNEKALERKKKQEAKL